MGSAGARWFLPIAVVLMGAVGCGGRSTVPIQERADTPQSQLRALIRAGDTAKAMSLLNANPSLVTMPNASNETPLHLAVAAKNADIVKLLLEKGAEVNARDDNDDTPLDVALKYKVGDPILEMLKSRGGER